MNNRPARALLTLAAAGAIASGGMLAGTGTAAAHGDHSGGQTHTHGTATRESCEIGRAWHWAHRTSPCFWVGPGIDDWTFFHYGD
ncbi:hypothetical protein [Nocardia sp. NPDC050406]|uniref:hypothetical protein n=1 Tax=Nocardia sp. NPDC050406 TaxID=3364318 RepID=UPI00379BEAEE